MIHLQSHSDCESEVVALVFRCRLWTPSFAFASQRSVLARLALFALVHEETDRYQKCKKSIYIVRGKVRGGGGGKWEKPKTKAKHADVMLFSDFKTIRQNIRTHNEKKKKNIKLVDWFLIELWLKTQLSIDWPIQRVENYLKRIWICRFARNYDLVLSWLQEKDDEWRWSDLRFANN